MREARLCVRYVSYVRIGMGGVSGAYLISPSLRLLLGSCCLSSDDEYLWISMYTRYTNRCFACTAISWVLLTVHPRTNVSFHMRHRCRCVLMYFPIVAFLDIGSPIFLRLGTSISTYGRHCADNNRIPHQVSMIALLGILFRPCFHLESLEAVIKRQLDLLMPMDVFSTKVYLFGFEVIHYSCLLW